MLDSQRSNTRHGMVSQHTFQQIVGLISPQLYQNRAIIASKNKLRPDGTVDNVWEFLHNLVTMLHAEGMSSDESDAEGEHTKYWVKNRQWHSKVLNQYLQQIDLDTN